MTLKFSLVLLISIVAFQLGYCQDADTAQNDIHKKIKVLPVPTFGYEPETKTRIGVVSLFTIDLHNDSNTRSSNAKLEFNYTFRKQLIFETGWNYFTKNEKLFSNGLLHVSQYPDLYYGIGTGATDENELLFNSSRKKIDLSLYKHIGHNVFVGGGFRYFNYGHITSDSFNSFFELRDVRNAGIKISAFHDTRNNLLNATSGDYILTDVEYNISASDYVKIKLDVRKYFQLQRSFSLSTRLLNTFVLNEPNFYDYSILGGDQFVRGYFYGRYRDKHLSTIQGELRTPHVKRIGLSFIGGISSLYSTPSSVFNQLRPNYGIGLRILFDKTDLINLRLDYVLGDEQNSGFYVAFGESF